jgi:hypothetical protein
LLLNRPNGLLQSRAIALSILGHTVAASLSKE